MFGQLATQYVEKRAYERQRSSDLPKFTDLVGGRALWINTQPLLFFATLPVAFRTCLNLYTNRRESGLPDLCRPPGHSTRGNPSVDLPRFLLFRAQPICLIEGSVVSLPLRGLCSDWRLPALPVCCSNFPVINSCFMRFPLCLTAPL